MNKFKSMLAAMALAVPSLIWAVPADPRIRTVKNPDGTTVQYRVHGDERFNFMTDAACKSIMHRDDKGFFVNTTRNGMPLAFNKDNVEMLRAEALANSASPEFFEYAPGVQTQPVNNMAKVATLDSEGRSTYPTIGNDTRSLVVLVEFQDVEFTVENPKDYFTRQLNEPGFSDYGGKGSAIDYYKDASHGLYTPTFDVYGPVKVSKNASYFQDNNTGHMALLIREAITQLHESGELDLSKYDFDNNGTVDTVFIYYAGYGSADSETETIWPHQYDYQYYVNWMNAPQLLLDGKKVGPYACANELKGWDPRTGKQSWLDGSEPWVDGIGTFVHEYGHVLGLPDLYDVAYSGGVVTPGEWDVMDSGCYNFNGCIPPLYSAYEQWVCRWLDYTDAEDANHYDLKALGNTESPTAVRIRIPVSATGSTFQPEYFVIEARHNSVWDACFPNSGLLVWRINYKKSSWTGNTVNSKSGSNVEIVYAKDADHPLFTDGAIFKGNGVELKPSREYSMWKHPVISSIDYDKVSMVGSFDYNMVQPTDVSTVLHDTPFAAEDGSRAFTLHWDAVEGVDSYLLTVRTVSNKRIVANCDNINVGNVTKFVVENVSSMNWKQELEAFVTCVVNGLTSSSVSNTITFKPMNLSLGENAGAVEGVDSDVLSIKGGLGCVEAPEGAVIYNLSGQQLRNENLAPGIYLVSFGSTTTKVLVR